MEGKNYLKQLQVAFKVKANGGLVNAGTATRYCGGLADSRIQGYLPNPSISLNHNSLQVTYGILENLGSPRLNIDSRSRNF